MPSDFTIAWGQITIAGIIGASIGLYLGHRFAYNRDRKKEFIQAGLNFRDSFIELLNLLEINSSAHPEWNKFQKTIKLVTKFYETQNQAFIRLEPLMSRFKRNRFCKAWYKYCCYDKQNKYPTFDDYKNTSDIQSELPVRQLAINRIKKLFEYTK